MRTLFLSHFYWPEVRTAPTNLAAARFLEDRGHRVQVLTGLLARGSDGGWRDAASMADAPRRPHAMPSAQPAALAANGRRAYLERLRRAVLLERLDGLLVRATGASKQPGSDR